MYDFLLAFHRNRVRIHCIPIVDDLTHDFTTKWRRAICWYHKMLNIS